VGKVQPQPGGDRNHGTALTFPGETMTYTYSIYRQRSGTKILKLWDGPSVFSLKYAKVLLKRRERQQPANNFFIVRDGQ
jgi:hypothetical protein